jgi:hypothetical protein
VLSSRIRRVLFICALTLAPLAIPASAAAIAQTSQITTPAGLTSPFGEQEAKITIAGTAKGISSVDVRCYSGPEVSAFARLAANVTVNLENQFSVEVPLASFYGACQLRAVPHEAKEGEEGLKLPPETTQKFEGPMIVPSFFSSEPTSFYAASSTLAGSLFFESAGEYGLESRLYSQTAHENAQFFYGEADLQAYPPIKTRSTVQVDSTDSYVPSAAHDVERVVENGVLPGLPALTLNKSFNEATHQLTIHEEDPVVKCMPGGTYPPTKASCTSFASTGVTLLRTWETTNEDHVASMTETWRSSDGHAHAVNARYYTEMWNGEVGGAFQFPGEAAFAPISKGETKTLPAGPAAILYKIKPSLPEAGDGEHPQGAIVYDVAPNEPLAVTRGSNEAKTLESVMEVPYQRTVPAGGSITMRMAFIQAFGLPEVRSLAAAALASYNPSVAIASPANGATITSATPSVAVSGTASDTGALSSLTVNGTEVPVSAGGAWSTTVALKPGVNAITATATDQAGLVASSAIAVTYKLPAATASLVGKARAANGQVSFTVACKGLAGTTCKVHATLTTAEKTRRGHLIGIAAKAKIRSKTVTIASVTVTIAAGKRAKLTLKLNATGRKLLKRFGKLPARLTAMLEGEGGRTRLLAQSITIKPKKHRHKH